ncbi:MAG: T9SS type A sorting domain-containing protein [Saprospiraceae bacterium]|nr:T9SS type A sorting domain-containing protein [Saprospiraceae bacterium]
MRTSFCVFLLICSLSISAQQQMFERLNYPAEVNGMMLKYPFAGGLNAPQFSNADLNKDGIQDLVVFDRVGNVLLTFLNNGIPNSIDYTYAPEYACNFPRLVDYVVMRDFDKDGAMDIFTGSVEPSRQEIQAHKGYYDGNVLKFTPYLFTHPGCTLCDPLYIHYPDNDQPGDWNNLPVNKGDIPAFDDINGDGDIDIVTFEAAAGGHVWLLENQSVELGLGLANMRFKLVTQCWGGFYESGLEACYCDLAPTPDCCAPCAFSGAVDDRDPLHPGSTLMTFDNDNDGDKEIVLGDVSFSCLNFLNNGGNPNKAWMTSQDIAYPSSNIPVDLAVFPAAFYLDLDNDGKNDMIVAPNNPTIGEDRKNVWFYKNTASAGHDFHLQGRALFTEDMIDLGSVTHPAFADVNADGLNDLVVGTYGYFTPGVPTNARLYLFLNTGTPTAPQFHLTDNDWLGMSEFAPIDYEFSPAFGDIDGDGALDLVIGNSVGGFYCYRNQADAGEPMQLTRDFNVMWAQMDVVGAVSTPILYDLDQDGLIDIVAGERTGYVNYFKNNGTSTTPLFSAVPEIGKVGQVDARTLVDAVGNCAPSIIQTEDGPLLIIGTQGGHFEAYFISDNLQDTFFLTDPLWGGIDEGSRSHAAFADLDSDGILEMVVGNTRGGLSMFKTVLKDCFTSAPYPPDAENNLKISPNPSSHWAKLEWAGKTDATWQAYNALGQLVANGQFNASVDYLDVKAWPGGIYFIEAVTGQERGTVRLVKH